MKILLIPLLAAFIPSNVVVKPSFTMALTFEYPIAANMNAGKITMPGLIHPTNYLRSDNMIITVETRDNFGSQPTSDTLNVFVDKNYTGINFSITLQDVYHEIYLKYSYRLSDNIIRDSKWFTLRYNIGPTQVLTFSDPKTIKYDSGNLGIVNNNIVYNEAYFELNKNLSSNLFDLKWLRFSSAIKPTFSSAKLYLPKRFDSEYEFQTGELVLKDLTKGYYGFEFKELTFTSSSNDFISSPSNNYGSYQLISIPPKINHVRMYILIKDFYSFRANAEIVINAFFHQNSLGQCGDNINEFCVNISNGESLNIDNKITYEV